VLTNDARVDPLLAEVYRVSHKKPNIISMFNLDGRLLWFNEFLTI